MAYADLTSEQKDILQNYVQLVRAWSGEQARTNNHGDVANTDYVAQVSTILGELSGSDIIPNESGLDGAASLTKDEVTTLTSHIQGVLINYNTSGHRQAWTKAAGSTNMIG